MERLSKMVFDKQFSHVLTYPSVEYAFAGALLLQGILSYGQMIKGRGLYGIRSTEAGVSKQQN